MSDNSKLHQILDLKDGRKLGFAEFGDLTGIPIFHFHGHPGSRLEILLQGDKPIKHGVHFIAVDRPGIGLSDFKPNRRLIDWPDDIVELADHLGLDKFIVEGASGGGPYSAVCAYKIPHRLNCCVIVAGLGPVDMKKEGMMWSNRIELFIARRLPFLVKMMVKNQIKKFENPEIARKFMLEIFEKMAESDKILAQDPRLLDLFVEEFKEAFRSGPNGVTLDEKIYAQPWGFKLSDISPDLQVYLWHGGLDVNVPISMGHEMCNIIPKCKGFFFPNEGHLSIYFNHFEEMLEILKTHYNK